MNDLVPRLDLAEAHTGRRPRSALFPYQERGVDFSIEAMRVALFCEPGTGKTAMFLTAASDLIVAGAVERVLYISHPRVVLSVPGGEIPRWEHLAHLNYVPVHAHGDEKLELLRAPADIYGVTFQGLQYIVDNAKHIRPFDMVVIDESTGVSNPQAKRTRYAAALTKRAQYVICATGTPTSQGYYKLWSQLFMLDRGARLGATPSPFKRRYFTQRGFQLHLNPGADKEIHAKVEDIVFVLRAEDWLSIPPVLEQQISVQLPADAREAYDKLEDELVALLRDGGLIDAKNAAAVLVKLHQMAQGSVLDRSGQAHRIHDEKLDALAELVEELDGEPLLVAYHYRADISRLANRFPEAEVLDTRNAAALRDSLDRWGRREIPLLFIHSASAGVGLDGLQAGGCHHLAYFSPAWSFEQRVQTTARLKRTGQTAQSVIVHNIIAVNTVDERVLEVLQGRRKGLETFMDALAYRLAEKAGDTSAEGIERMRERLRELRKKAAAAHPDKGGTEADFIAAHAEAQAAKEQLKQAEQGDIR